VPEEAVSDTAQAYMEVQTLRAALLLRLSSMPGDQRLNLALAQLDGLADKLRRADIAERANASAGAWRKYLSNLDQARIVGRLGPVLALTIIGAGVIALRGESPVCAAKNCRSPVPANVEERAAAVPSLLRRELSIKSVVVTPARTAIIAPVSVPVPRNRPPTPVLSVPVVSALPAIVPKQRPPQTHLAAPADHPPAAPAMLVVTPAVTVPPPPADIALQSDQPATDAGQGEKGFKISFGQN
jgi:hypothetical protein